MHCWGLISGRLLAAQAAGVTTPRQTDSERETATGDQQETMGVIRNVEKAQTVTIPHFASLKPTFCVYK